MLQKSTFFFQLQTNLFPHVCISFKVERVRLTLITHTQSGRQTLVTVSPAHINVRVHPQIHHGVFMITNNVSVVFVQQPLSADVLFGQKPLHLPPYPPEQGRPATSILYICQDSQPYSTVTSGGYKTRYAIGPCSATAALEHIYRERGSLCNPACLQHRPAVPARHPTTAKSMPVHSRQGLLITFPNCSCVSNSAKSRRSMNAAAGQQTQQTRTLAYQQRLVVKEETKKGQTYLPTQRCPRVEVVSYSQHPQQCKTQQYP